VCLSIQVALKSRTPWPIHFKFHRVIGIDGLTVCILYDKISNFHSRVMGLYSSNCRQLPCDHDHDGLGLHLGFVIAGKSNNTC
jgi:hypothetical protein